MLQLGEGLLSTMACVNSVHVRPQATAFGNRKKKKPHTASLTCLKKKSAWELSKGGIRDQEFLLKPCRRPSLSKASSTFTGPSPHAEPDLGGDLRCLSGVYRIDMMVIQ